MLKMDGETYSSQRNFQRLLDNYQNEFGIEFKRLENNDFIYCQSSIDGIDDANPNSIIKIVFLRRDGNNEEKLYSMDIQNKILKNIPGQSSPASNHKERLQSFVSVINEILKALSGATQHQMLSADITRTILHARNSNSNNTFNGLIISLANIGNGFTEDGSLSQVQKLSSLILSQDVTIERIEKNQRYKITSTQIKPRKILTMLINADSIAIINQYFTITPRIVATMANDLPPMLFLREWDKFLPDAITNLIPGRLFFSSSDDLDLEETMIQRMDFCPSLYRGKKDDYTMLTLIGLEINVKTLRSTMRFIEAYFNYFNPSDTPNAAEITQFKTRQHAACTFLIAILLSKVLMQRLYPILVSNTDAVDTHDNKESISRCLAFPFNSEWIRQDDEDAEEENEDDNIWFFNNISRLIFSHISLDVSNLTKDEQAPNIYHFTVGGHPLCWNISGATAVLFNPNGGRTLSNARTDSRNSVPGDADFAEVQAVTPDEIPDGIQIENGVLNLNPTAPVLRGQCRQHAAAIKLLSRAEDIIDHIWERTNQKQASIGGMQI
jgi:hypothetical protein